METLGKRQICIPNEKKMADSWFALSNQNIVEQVEENEKRKQKRFENYNLVECLANIGD